MNTNVYAMQLGANRLLTFGATALKGSIALTARRKVKDLLKRPFQDDDGQQRAFDELSPSAQQRVVARKESMALNQAAEARVYRNFLRDSQAKGGK